MTTEEALQRITSFFDQFKIPYEETQLEETFLPGVALGKGKVLYDPAKLKYPGDLLHEAGHFALSLPEERPLLHGNMAEEFPHKEDEEMAAMCWSYLASKVAGIPVEILFHEGGYKGQAHDLRMAFESGNFIGLPLLEWMDMVRKTPDGRIEIMTWLRPEISEESEKK
tara:strand:- start:467 stop:970 length:504 start_codon:yes stop_codon:yes gene_type:complete